MKQPVYARVINVRAVTVDCSTIAIRAEILEGPEAILKRQMDIVINKNDAISKVLWDLMNTMFPPSPEEIAKVK